VTELVLDHNTEERQLGNGHGLLRAHDLVGVSDAANILHRSVLVIWAHHMIDLTEWVPLSERLLVKVKSGFRDTEHELVSEVLSQRLSNEDSLWDVHGVKIFVDLVGTGTDRVQVSRDAGSLLELAEGNVVEVTVKVEEPLDAVALEHSSTLGSRVLISFLDTVGDGLP